MKYYVRRGEEERVVELTAEGIRLDGEAVTVELARVPGSPERHLRLGDRGFPFTARRRDGGWEIEAYGRRVHFEVEDERARRIRQLAGLPERVQRTRELRAPMPGRVIKLWVAPGQAIERGDPLVVVEAMKMENELRAETAGVVASVEVREGEAVNRGDLLVSFE